MPTGYLATMSGSVSPYVLSTATTRCKSAQWALSSYLTAARGLRSATTSASIRASAATAVLVAAVVETLEQGGADLASVSVRRMIDRAVEAALACVDACNAIATEMPTAADCARSCEACIEALRRLVGDVDATPAGVAIT